MKFTEEQYRGIIKAWRSERIYQNSTQAVIDYLIDDINVSVTDFGAEALALANPTTRDLVYDKYVEKEKKYYWKLNGLFLVKSVSDGSLYFDKDDGDSLSESEIREWGFNPEMFDKEHEKII